MQPFNLSELDWSLFHHDHLAGGAVASGFHAEEIQATGHLTAGIIGAVPHDLVFATVHHAAHQAAHFLPLLIVDIQDRKSVV